MSATGAMSTARTFFSSTIGMKVIMAITGLVMAGFLVGHVAGNLLVFVGRDAINGYAAALKSTLPLLWGTRIALLLAVIGHVWSALRLTALNRAARPVAYKVKTPQASTVASRTMVLGGLTLLAFIVFHLLHFTVGMIEPVPFSHTDVYANMVGAFQIPWVSALYVFAMVALGGHLFHGLWSSFRTVGVTKASPNPFKRGLSIVVAVGLWLGFTIIPIGILAGAVK